VPLSLVGYAAVAWFSGAVNEKTANMLKGFVNRKLRRRA
jgi:hypothetical protein